LIIQETKKINNAIASPFYVRLNIDDTGNYLTLNQPPALPDGTTWEGGMYDKNKNGMKISFDTTNDQIQNVNLGYYNLNFDSFLCLTSIYLTAPVSTLTSEITESTLLQDKITTDLINTGTQITLIETTTKYNIPNNVDCKKDTKKCNMSSFLFLLSLFLLVSYLVHFTFYWIFLYLFLKTRNSI
jgi:hypothetical protein